MEDSRDPSVSREADGKRGSEGPGTSLLSSFAHPAAFSYKSQGRLAAPRADGADGAMDDSSGKPWQVCQETLELWKQSEVLPAPSEITWPESPALARCRQGLQMSSYEVKARLWDTSNNRMCTVHIACHSWQ